MKNDRLQLNSQQGVGLIAVMSLVFLSMTLTGAMVMMMVSTANQSNAAEAWEESYGIGLGAIHKTIFEVEAACGGNNPPDSVKEVETYLTEELGGAAHTGTKTFTGTLDGKSYSVAMTDPTPSTVDDLLQLQATVNQDGLTRTVTALVKGPDQVDALKYALYGNYIHFDNHAKLTGAMVLETSIFSNSGILVDKGVTINGSVEAVQYVSANTGPADGEAGVPDTIFGTSGSPVPARQGDPDPSPTVSSAPVTQVIPPPPLKDFPSVDFDLIETLADTANRKMVASHFETLLDSARAYALTQPASDSTQYNLPDSEYPGSHTFADLPVKVMHRNSTNHREIRVPNGANNDYVVELGSDSSSCPSYPCASGSGTDETYEIIIEGDPLANNDTVLYLDGDGEINMPADTLVRVEGSIIANGSFEVKSAAELLAWENRQAPWFVPLDESLYENENPIGTPVDGPGFDFATTAGEVADPASYDIRYSTWPAIAANGKLKIDGDGGPAHIEGVVYTVSESHLHRSDPWAPAYSVGSEIADTIHNCQFFSFAYDPQALEATGFYARGSGRPYLKIIRLSAE